MTARLTRVLPAVKLNTVIHFSNIGGQSSVVLVALTFLWDTKTSHLHLCVT